MLWSKILNFFLKLRNTGKSQVSSRVIKWEWGKTKAKLLSRLCYLTPVDDFSLLTQQYSEKARENEKKIFGEKEGRL